MKCPNQTVSRLSALQESRPVFTVRPTYNPTKPRAYGTTKAVVAAAFNECGGPKRVADLIERKAGQVNAYSDPDSPSNLSFEQARILTKAGAQAFVEDLCSQAGGAFMPAGIAPEPFPALASDSSIAHGEFVSRVLLALSDGQINGRERLDILRELDEAIRILIEARTKLASSVVAN